MSYPFEDPFVGIQITAKKFENNEPGAVLDEIMEGFPLNAIMLFHSHNLRRTAGHRAGTIFEHPQLNIDEKGQDLFDRLQPITEERGLKIIMGMGEDSWGYQDRYPSYSSIAMVDSYGRRHRQSCPNNPAWRDFQAASIEDAVREHPFLDGIMFMHERCGPLANLFITKPYGDGRYPFCFCEHCRKIGVERGINPDRAREGFTKLLELVHSAEAGDPAPADGWFLSIWRLLMRYHEIMAWDQLWWDGLHDYRAALAGAAKMVKREISVGYHFQHAVSLINFLWKAGDDPERVAQYADWFKPSVYPGCSGARSRNKLNKIHATLFRDMPKSVARDFLSWIMLRDPATEPDLLDPDMEQGAFGADWVKGEIERLTKPGLRPVVAGLGIGVPGGDKAETPELITECTEACFQAGGKGILFSREYTEMAPELVKAAGDVVRRHMAG